MAVQAQNPSASLFLSDFGGRVCSTDKRIFASAMGTPEESHPPVAAGAVNLFRVSNGVAAVNFPQQLVPIGGTHLNETDSKFLYCLPGSWKRSRECDELLNTQHAFIPTVDCERRGSSSPILASQPAPISPGLRLSFDDCQITSPTSTSGRGCTGSSIMSILSQELQSRLSKQSEEMEQLIKIQAERMKVALEDKRKRHARALLSAVEESLSKRLKAKDDDLEKALRTNMELEERVKQLGLETQLWQNVARNNELVASNLRSSLEQVVAQSREQSREGCGESVVEDAESCQLGDAGDLHARACKENKELKLQRSCRVCRTNTVCILLLPCRHLCLCKKCEGRGDACPLCGVTKDASVQVYMS